MPEYLAPGVYVEEVPSGNMPIQAASTSTAGMVGCTARGPVGVPTLVTSLGAYARLFGGKLHPLVFTGGRDALPYAAEGFFANGGARLYIVRVAGAAARESTLDIGSERALSLAADADAGDTEVELASLAGLAEGMVLRLGGNAHRITGIDADEGTVTLDPPLAAALEAGATGSTAMLRALALAADAEAGDDTLELDGAGLRPGMALLIGGESHAVTAIDAEAGTVTIDPVLAADAAAGDTVSAPAPLLRIHARWPGGWGNALRVTLGATPLLRTRLDGAVSAGATELRLDTAFGLFPGSVIAIGGQRAEVVSADANSRLVTLASALTADADDAAEVVSQEFSLLVERIEGGKAVESENFDRLSFAATHPRGMAAIVGGWDAARGRPSDSGGSGLVRLENLTDAATRVLPLAPTVRALLSGGDDDVAGIDADAFIGNVSDDPALRSGIQALANEPTISLVAVPGQTGAPGANDVTVQQALVEHCERMLYRFAVLEVPLGSTVAQARAHRQNFDSTRVSVNYPGLVVPDGFGNPGDRRVIHSSGHLLGIYARTDITRGVHKVPANEVVRGILGFETKLTKGEQDILNPLHLNCFRDFREENRGLRIYGGRVATSNPEFRYINVRRLLLFIEQSLDTGLQWAVFEPNSEPTWATVKQSITGFLTTVWRDGGLEGLLAEEAFEVHIGYDVTMTQDDIDNGRMIAVVKVAPVKPAEFVIIRISQKTREAAA